MDPFAGDPSDPAAELGPDDEVDEPLTDEERMGLLELSLIHISEPTRH